MSTPVVTEKWAGQFDCSVCRRKRLIGAEFSKKNFWTQTQQALERYRKNDGGVLKCKTCVAAAEAQEREAAATRRKEQPPSQTSSAATAAEDEEKRECTACQQELSLSAYNRNQWSKGPGKSRCRSCVETSVEAEATQHDQSKADAIKQARADLEKAELTPADTLGVVKAAAKLSALEAELVTGLRPKIIRRPMRGGRSGRSSSGRGSKR